MRNSLPTKSNNIIAVIAVLALTIGASWVTVNYDKISKPSTSSADSAVSLNIQNVSRGVISEKIWGVNIFHDHDSYATNLYANNGINVDRSEFGYFTNSLTYDKLNSLGTKTIRFPYGCTADLYNWKNGTLNYKYYSLTRTNFAFSNVDQIYKMSVDLNSDFNYILNIEYHNNNTAYTPCNFTPLYPGKSDAENRQILINDARDLALQYKGRIVTYEIGNEQWASWTPQDYVTMAIDVANAIKSVNPNARLGIQGSYPGMWNYQQWNTAVSQVVNNKCGTTNCFDFVTHHTYHAVKYDPAKAVGASNYKGMGAYAAASEINKNLVNVKNTFPGKEVSVTEWGPGGCTYSKTNDSVNEAGLLTFEAIRTFVDNGVTDSHISENLFNNCSLLVGSKDLSFSGQALAATSNARGGTLLQSSIPNNIIENNGYNYRDIPVLSQFSVKKGNDLYVYIGNKHETTDYKVQLNFDSGLNIAQYKIAEIKTLAGTTYDATSFSDKYAYVAPSNGMQVTVPHIGIVRVRLSTLTRSQLTESYTYSRICDFDNTQGVPPAGSCGKLEVLESDRFRGGGTQQYKAAASFLFNNFTKIRQSFVSGDGKTLYYRICDFNAGSGDAVCGSQPYITSASSAIRGVATDVFTGYTTIKYYKSGAARIKLYYLIDPGNKVYIRDCAINDVTGEVPSCTAIGEVNIAALRGIGNETYSGLEFFTYNNGTKLRQTFIAADGKGAYYRNCDFNQSLGEEACTGVPFTPVDYSNMQGSGDEYYMGYSLSTYQYNGNYKLKQTFVGGYPYADPVAVNQPPRGNLDAIDTAGIATGWAIDDNTANTPINVHFYLDGAAGAGGTYIGAALATVNRADVGVHGFTFTLPDSVRDGKAHTLYVHAIDSSGNGPNNLISGVPKSFNLAPPLKAPTLNLPVVCSQNGTRATLSWQPLAGATAGYHVRLNQGTTYPGTNWQEWNNQTATSFTFTIQPNLPYVAWVHGANLQGVVPGGWGPEAQTGVFQCNAPVSTPRPTPPPPVLNLPVVCSQNGTRATLSWQPMTAATAGYHVRISEGSAIPGANGQSWNNYSGTSITFTISPNSAYTAWVHGANAQGVVDGGFGPYTSTGVFQCTGPTQTATPIPTPIRTTAPSATPIRTTAPTAVPTAVPTTAPTPSITNPPVTSNSITIVASGTGALNASNQTEYPLMALNINGIRVKQWYVTQTLSPYVFTPTTQVTDKIRVEYLNDQETDPAVDRNLRIDYIQYNGRTYQAESAYMNGYWDSTRGCIVGNNLGEWVFCNGYVDFTLTQAPTAAPTTVPTAVPTNPPVTPSSTPTNSQAHTINIVALGSGANNSAGQMEYPKAALTINGTRLREWFVTESFINYTYTYIGSISNLKVEYLNDQESDSANDRNMRVDYVSVDGIRYDSENMYSVGTWNGSNCSGGYRNSEWLHCDGYFEYALTNQPGPTSVPTTVPTNAPTNAPTSVPGGSYPKLLNASSSELRIYETQAPVGSTVYIQVIPNTTKTIVQTDFYINGRWTTQDNSQPFFLGGDTSGTPRGFALTKGSVLRVVGYYNTNYNFIENSVTY